MKMSIKQLLARILHSNPSVEYISDVATQMDSTNGWTCPGSGLVIASVKANGGAAGYYIQDATQNSQRVCDIYDNSRYDNTVCSNCFPVIKGHTYRQDYYAGKEKHAMYFRFNMKE